MSEERYEELTEELVGMIGKMRKELLWTRVISGVLAVLMLGMIIVGSVFVHEVHKYGEQVVDYVVQIEEYVAELDPMLEELAKIDAEAINSAIESLDVEAINSAIAALDVETINETFANVDGESLGETITRMDEILDGMDGASAKIEEMTQNIKDFFGWSE